MRYRTPTAGFSLIELLVVLGIVALSMSVVAPKIGSAIDTSHYRASVRAVLGAARLARNLARKEQREVALIFDVAQRTFQIDDRRKNRIKPDATQLRVTGATSEIVNENRLAVRFFPDGSATGGHIKFTWNTESHAIDIDWLTGFAALE